MSARAWLANDTPRPVSGMSSTKGVRPVMMPADVPGRLPSLRVSQRCSGDRMKARKIAQAIEPANGCSTSNSP